MIDFLLFFHAFSWFLYVFIAYCILFPRVLHLHSRACRPAQRTLRALELRKRSRARPSLCRSASAPPRPSGNSPDRENRSAQGHPRRPVGSKCLYKLRAAHRFQVDVEGWPILLIGRGDSKVEEHPPPAIERLFMACERLNASWNKARSNLMKAK